MKNNWYNFYEKRVNSTYQRYFEFKYHPFLNTILEEKPRQIVETGCGIGSVSKFIKQYNIDCFGFDIDRDIVKLANKNTNTDVFFKGDIFDKELAEFVTASNNTLAVSHGVLEHFNDNDIKKILKLYPYSVHYVPLKGYGKPSFGDERLLTQKEWLHLVKPKRYKVFNNGLDLMFLIKN